LANPYRRTTTDVSIVYRKTSEWLLPQITLGAHVSVSILADTAIPLKVILLERMCLLDGVPGARGLN
jgi:hypothetical protein